MKREENGRKCVFFFHYLNLIEYYCSGVSSYRKIVAVVVISKKKKERKRRNIAHTQSNLSRKIYIEVNHRIEMELIVFNIEMFALYDRMIKLNQMLSNGF